jgi:ATP-dependent Lon protease
MSVLDSVIHRTSPFHELPLVPVRELVVFPHTVIPFFVGKSSSIAALEAAMNKDRKAFVSCQKFSSNESDEGSVYEAGTVVSIVQMLRLPDGTARALVEGIGRARIKRFIRHKDFDTVELVSFPVTTEISSRDAAMMKSVQKSFESYADFQKKIPPEVQAAIDKAEGPDKLADLICHHMNFKLEKKQELLAIEDCGERLEAIAVAVETENEVIGLQKKISARVRNRMEKSQRDYVLNEQLKEINKELGKDAEDLSASKELETRIKARGMPSEANAKAVKELERLAKLQPMSPEAAVLRTYLEWMADLPWNERTKDNRDLDLASRILDEDHYNMKKAKERILDFIAVRLLKGDSAKGPILCFVGPPGTGKTSLGRSVARALGRNFVRMSLGGVRDEAEIRGHRKTYVGALPGKILQSIKKAGSVNPVFLLDEIDKMSSDFRGDPASALLEVLDPEQNSTFTDHYLEVAYDLSRVMFITTANSLHNIPMALIDRMEVIEIPGYSEYEKLAIAQNFIIPRQLVENGLKDADIKFRKDAILDVIRYYSMESGVRNLERQIASVVRKIAREAVKEGFASTQATVPAGSESAGSESTGTTSSPDPEAEGKVPGDTPAGVQAKSGATGADESAADMRGFTRIVSARSLQKYLGKRSREDDLVYQEERVGVVNGLAWTELGGTLLPVETVLYEGTGELILTGNLGDVMKESAKAALSYIRSRREGFGIESKAFQKNNIHVHVPEGAIPKDGPSAGITLTCAMLSALSGVAVRKSVAMTGEITLSGRILPIGGVKEKVLAAHRNGIKTIFLPEKNRKDLDEIPREVIADTAFLFADTVDEALRVLFPVDLWAKAPKTVPRT